MAGNFKNAGGTLHIPSSSWEEVRSTLMETWNADQKDMLVKAKDLHTQLEKEVEGKKGLRRQEAISQYLARYLPTDRGRSSELRDLLVKEQRAPGRINFTLKRRPHVRDLVLAPETMSTGTLRLELSSISLNAEEQTITWAAEDIEVAKRHPFISKMLKILEDFI